MGSKNNVLFPSLNPSKVYFPKYNTKKNAICPNYKRHFGVNLLLVNSPQNPEYAIKAINVTQMTSLVYGAWFVG